MWSIPSMKKTKTYSKIDLIPKGNASDIITKGCMCLEGGAFRGTYTAGVLDFLMQHDINLETTIGISAGSLCGMLYVSGDIGRVGRINLLYRHDTRYVGLKAYPKNKGLIGFDFCLNDVNWELPFNAERFYDTKRRFIAVATDIETGKAAYFEKGKCADILKAVQASSSMPYISRPVNVEGRLYLDGGVSCKVPYRYALDHGFEKIVVIMTRQQGYRKKSSKASIDYAKICYLRHPEFAMRLGHSQDNANLEYDEIDRLGKDGRIFVIYPRKPITISRLEGDMEKLGNLYFDGYEDAGYYLPMLKEYLYGRS